MPITELPTKAVGSLGPEKTDSRAYVNPGTELPAIELEAIKSAIIELYGEVGLSDGSTADSINASPAGAPNLQLGALLWEWNETDVSQFEVTALSHGSDLGGAGDGDSTLALTAHVYGQPFVRAGNATGIVLRITATSLTGGGVFPVLASELTLPERYVLVARYAHHSTTQIRGGIYPWLDGTADGLSFDGYFVDRHLSSNSHQGRAVKAGDINASSLDNYGSPGTWDQDAIDSGGMQAIYTVHQRPAGATPAYARMSAESRCGSGIEPRFAQEVPSTSAFVSTSWDGIDMDRFGIGVWALNAAQSGTVDVSRLRIYAHPDD